LRQKQGRRREKEDSDRLNSQIFYQGLFVLWRKKGKEGHSFFRTVEGRKRKVHRSTRAFGCIEEPRGRKRGTHWGAPTKIKGREGNVFDHHCLKDAVQAVHKKRGEKEGRGAE